MNTELKATGFDNLVLTLERVLDKFNEIDSKMTTLHEELDYVMEELVVSRAEIRQTCETIKKLDTAQVHGEELQEKVSSTFEHLISQMSQIVHTAREGLLVRTPASEEKISEDSTDAITDTIAEKTVAEEPVAEEPAFEMLKTETEEPVITENQPELDSFSEDNLPSMEEVHETLKEVAKTLVEGETHLTDQTDELESEPPESELMNQLQAQPEETPEETTESHSVEEPVMETEESQAPNPLAELNDLLTNTKKEITQELVGSGENEADTDIPMASEPPELLKETLSKIGSFAEAGDGIPTEDLGQEPEGAPTSEINELLKNISSSYVAGTPE